jgi:SWI/SNF-related matrix-associated actin-dependent regulator 1 of chromatin subfamily A
MGLTFNESQGTFILTTADGAAAEAAGLTLSTLIRGPKGEKVYYTADYESTGHKPVFNPYAALPFWRQADEKALAKLRHLIDDYEASWAMDTDKDYPYPDARRAEGKSYMPFQKAGIEYALRRGNCLIGDEPGLGKTIQAIGIANACGAEKVLVLCPATIRKNWQREIHDWSVLPRLKTYPIYKSADGVSPVANYVICSYDLARNPNIHDALYAIKWDMLIIDEAHYLKSTDAIRTRAVFGGGARSSKFSTHWLADRTDRIVGLTGTPLPNRPRECYTVARALNWESIDWASYDSFLFRYNPSMQVSTGHTVEEKGRLPELQARLRCNFMVRRMKKDVLPQLPDKRYEMSYVEPNGAISEILAREKLIDFDPMELFNPDFMLDGTPISTLRRLMGEAKIPRVVEHLKYLLDIVEIPKLVVFTHHNSVMNALLTAMAPYGTTCIRGGMSTLAKDANIQDFVNSDKRIFFGQLDTMEGIDGLQRVCDHVVFAEPAWNPGRNEQCVDRCHRIGQHGNVLAQFLIVEGSLDEKVLHIVLGKAQAIHASLDKRFE